MNLIARHPPNNLPCIRFFMQILADIIWFLNDRGAEKSHEYRLNIDWLDHDCELGMGTTMNWIRSDWRTVVLP